MSHRSRLLQERKRVAPGIGQAPSNVPAFSNMQPRPRPQQIGPAELIPKLLEQGMVPQYKIQICQDPKIVRFIAAVGPIEIPLDFTPELTRKLLDEFCEALDKVDPEPEIMVSDAGPGLSMADALAEADRSLEDLEAIQRHADELAQADLRRGEEELGYTLVAEACTDSPE